MSIVGASDGAALVIFGLPTGSTLSSGRPVEVNGWRIVAADLHDAVIRLPRGFVRAVDLSVELHLADETIADRRSVRLERPEETAGVGVANTESAEIQTVEAQTQPAALLDLLRIEGARRVQQRLIELGFLSGDADGVWGTRSRSALRGFRIANRLGSDDTWDDRTQRELFVTSATSASAANQLDVTKPIAEAGAMRNPLDRSDALWIQRRLHDLGYYFGKADAVWGVDSRSALRDFKHLNGLAEDGTWDKETEQWLSLSQNVKYFCRPLGPRHWSMSGKTKMAMPRSL